MNKKQLLYNNIEKVKEMCESLEYDKDDICKYFNVSKSTLDRFLYQNEIKSIAKYRGKFKNGQIINNLTLIKPLYRKNSNTYFKIRCFCGKEFIADVRDIYYNKTHSCGCLLKERKQSKKIDMTGFKNQYLEVVKHNKNTNKWICKCLNCGSFFETDGSSIRGEHTKSCGCLISSGEYLIKKILNRNNINYKTQITFPDLRSSKNNKLRFDFGIYNNENKLICLIEYDGEQHFFTEKDKDNLFFSQELKINDELKNQYCQKNNIKLIRIPYYDKNKITMDYLIEKFDL